jgi:hypothetical protein
VRWISPEIEVNNNNDNIITTINNSNSILNIKNSINNTNNM